MRYVTRIGGTILVFLPACVGSDRPQASSAPTAVAAPQASIPAEAIGTGASTSQPAASSPVAALADPPSTAVTAEPPDAALATAVTALAGVRYGFFRLHSPCTLPACAGDQPQVHVVLTDDPKYCAEAASAAVSSNATVLQVTVSLPTFALGEAAGPRSLLLTDSRATLRPAAPAAASRATNASFVTVDLSGTYAADGTPGALAYTVRLPPPAGAAALPPAVSLVAAPSLTACPTLEGPEVTDLTQIFYRVDYFDCATGVCGRSISGTLLGTSGYQVSLVATDDPAYCAKLTATGSEPANPRRIQMQNSRFQPACHGPCTLQTVPVGKSVVYLNSPSQTRSPLATEPLEGSFTVDIDGTSSLALLGYSLSPMSASDAPWDPTAPLPRFVSGPQVARPCAAMPPSRFND